MVGVAFGVEVGADVLEMLEVAEVAGHVGAQDEAGDDLPALGGVLRVQQEVDVRLAFQDLPQFAQVHVLEHGHSFGLLGQGGGHLDFECVVGAVWVGRAVLWARSWASPATMM